MFSWSLLYGGLAYIIAGLVMNSITTKYIQKLTDEVMEVYGNKRYAEMLWYSVPAKDTKLNRFLVDVAFTVFWPAICIAAILKAEWNYDKITRRNAFRKNAP